MAGLDSACRSSEPAAPPAPAPSESAPTKPAPPPSVPTPEPPLPDHAVLDEAIRAAKARAQREVLAPSEALQPDLAPLAADGAPVPTVAPGQLPGFFTPLQMPPHGDPLAALERGLSELWAGTRTEPVRLAIYGASGTAADLWTGYLRRYLQARFGDGGPGIVSAAPQNRWYRHHEFSITGSKHWTKHNAYRREGETDPGYFGPMGVCHDTDHKRAWAEIAKSKRAPAERALAFYDVLHLAQPGGGSYRLLLDGKRVAEVDTALAAGQARPHLDTHRVPVVEGHPKLRIEAVGDGPIRLLGVVAETGKPGVVVDTFGIDGARVENQLRWDQAVWAEGIRRRDPVLYVLAFGTNASVDEDLDLSLWETGYRTVLNRFRDTLPDAGCVILGPGDYPIVQGDQISPRPQLDEIRAITQRLAPEFGCAFWDAMRFEGGDGSKPAWVQAGLARDDYLHLTRAGYVRLGMGFADALMQRFDWRRQQADHG